MEVSKPARSRTYFNPISTAVSAGVDLVLPPACCFCTRPMSSESFGSERIRLCRFCTDRLATDDRQACHRCGIPVGPYIDPTGGCVNCARRRFSFSEVIRLGVYEDELRDACIRAKYPGAEALAGALGELLWREQQSRLETPAPDIIVPVPQHWCHMLSRPHHAAVSIATALANRLEIPCRENLVRKTRWTIDQSSLTRAQRLKNLSGAFRVARRARLSGLSVLLVDDILTTGSTAGEIARMLRKAGAKQVTVAVVAVVP